MSARELHDLLRERNFYPDELELMQHDGPRSRIKRVVSYAVPTLDEFNDDEDQYQQVVEDPAISKSPSKKNSPNRKPNAKPKEELLGPSTDHGTSSSPVKRKSTTSGQFTERNTKRRKTNGETAAQPPPRKTPVKRAANSSSKQTGAAKILQPKPTTPRCKSTGAVSSFFGASKSLTTEPGTDASADFLQTPDATESEASPQGSPIQHTLKPAIKPARYSRTDSRLTGDERTCFTLRRCDPADIETAIDEALLENIAKALQARARRQDKPPPSGHHRDYLDSSVVVARAGGGMEQDAKTGQMTLARDQEAGAQIRSLQRNMAEYRPVGIIVGGKHADIQSKMPYTYQFLDWFKPTDIWCEKWNGHVVVRYRFEKLRCTEPSWWTPSGEDDELHEVKDHQHQLEPVQRICEHCSVPSLQVYLNGWMCLNPPCHDFWAYEDGSVPIEDSLVYDPRFLKRRTSWPHASTPWDTKPNPFELSATSAAGETHLEELGELTKAIVCPKCGRCTAAKYWSYWVCGNPECQMRVDLPKSNLNRAALRELTNPISSGYSFSKDVFDTSLKLEISFVGNYRVHKYTLPGVPGFVAHMMANKTIVEETGGPDDMFLDLQQNEIGLERRPKGDTRIAGENLCDHYTLNFGMPYKFVATPDSKPFALAPKSVAMARSQLIWAMRALGIIDEPEFNELMVLGYKSANKIGFHDDGEEGLGPTVATLSVGCPAEMKMKMQEKYFRGFTGVAATKHFTDKLPPIPGGNKYAERLAAYEELIKLKDTDKAAFNAKKKSLPQELGLVGGGNKTGAPEVLKMRLAHGDIVVMHGALIQAYYLHCVEPKGSLRFAFTCRNILANHLKDEELPDYKVEKDVIMYDGFKLPRPQ